MTTLAERYFVKIISENNQIEELEKELKRLVKVRNDYIKLVKARYLRFKIELGGKKQAQDMMAFQKPYFQAQNDEIRRLKHITKNTPKQITHEPKEEIPKLKKEVPVEIVRAKEKIHKIDEEIIKKRNLIKKLKTGSFIVGGVAVGAGAYLLYKNRKKKQEEKNKK